MKPFTINTNHYFLPERWEEVTYHQFEQIQELDLVEMSAAEKTTKQVSILTNVPEEILKKAPYHLVIQLHTELDFLTEKPQPAAKAHVTINNTVYHAKTLYTVEEWTAYHKILNAFKDETHKQYPFILAILMRKALKSTQTNWLKRVFGKKTTSEPAQMELESFVDDGDFIQKQANMFKNALNVVDVMSLSAFFLNNSTLFTNLTSHYLELNQEKATALTKIQQLSELISMRNTDTWQTSSIWSRIQCIIVKCYVWALIRSLTYSNTKKK